VGRLRGAKPHGAGGPLHRERPCRALEPGRVQGQGGARDAVIDSPDAQASKGLRAARATTAHRDRAGALLRPSDSILPGGPLGEVCSRTQGFDMNHAGTAGNLCLGNPVGGLVGGVIPNSGATGIVQITADLTVMPQPGGAVAVQPGETWNFQCWYRDAVVGGSATSNFSDGLEVLFTATQTVPGMVPIPAGMYLMGSIAPSGPPYHGSPNEQPVHQVTISTPF
jgi:hypothetical protein